MAKRRGNNEGSIYQRNTQRWQAQVSIDGKRLGKTFDTRRECQEWLRQIESQKDKGLSLSGAKTILDTFLLEWLEAIRPNLKPKTWRQYHLIVDRYVIPFLGKKQIINIKPYDIQGLYTKLRQNGTGARTIQLTHSVLHNAFSKAFKWGLITTNPVSIVDKPKTDHREMKVLNYLEVRQFLNACSSHRLKVLFRMAITTGLRMGELKGLNWSDVDWAESSIHVQRQLQRQQGIGQVLSSPKTKGSIRKVGIGPITLRELMKHRKSLVSTSGIDPSPSDFIFTNTSGKPLGSSGIQKAFKKLLADAGLPQIRFHDLRHTAASLMLSNGTPVFQVSRQLGHTRASTTLDVYGHLIPGLEFNSAAKIEELVDPIATELQLDKEWSEVKPDENNNSRHNELEITRKSV